jgi:hypothetical protein
LNARLIVNPQLPTAMPTASDSSAQQLRDSEARVRALTREVGSLREDLRREVKRRERAVQQARPLRPWSNAC